MIETVTRASTTTTPPPPPPAIKSAPAATTGLAHMAQQDSNKAPAIKPKNQKSRNGCLTCKKKRLKCDETKPSCNNCLKKNIECGGYSTNFKWKSFEETSTSFKVKKQSIPTTSSASSSSASFQTSTPTTTQQQQQTVPKPTRNVTPRPITPASVSSSVGSISKKNDKLEAKRSQAISKSMERAISLPESNIFQSAMQRASISIAGKTFQELARQNELMAMGKNPNSKSAGTSPPVEPTHRFGSQEPHPPIQIKKEIVGTTNSLELPPLHDQFQYNLGSPVSGGFNKRSSSFSAVNVGSSSVMNTQAFSLPSPGFTGSSPSFSTLVKAFTDFESMNIPSPSNIDLTPKIEEAIEDEDEEELSSLDENYGGKIPVRRANSLDSVFAGNTESVGGPLSPRTQQMELFQFHNGTKNFEFKIPPHFVLSKNISEEFETIARGLHNFTSPIMTVKTYAENPWQKYVWPMALENSALFKAVASMTLTHLGKDDENLKKKALVYMKQSINELADGMTNNTISDEAALATCFSLMVSETWHTQTTLGIAHLRGTKGLIQKMLRSNKSLSPYFKWLCNSFIYHDVLAKLVSSTLIDSTTYDEDSPLVTELKKFDNSNNRLLNVNKVLHGEEFEFSMEDVDPLLGCSRDLFFIIGRVATLITKFKTTKKTLSMVSNAVTLKNELTNWKPSIGNFKSTDPFCDTSSLMATAEAYRYSALLYLHQAIPEIPSLSSKDLAEKVLMLLASIPTNSRTGLLHIFPLLVASCEVDSEEEREWCMGRWQILSNMMLIGNIDRAIEVVREVWRRKDSTIGKGKSGSDVDWDVLERIDALTQNKKDDLEAKGINSRTHWSMVMKEWGWEVLLG